MVLVLFTWLFNTASRSVFLRKKAMQRVINALLFVVLLLLLSVWLAGGDSDEDALLEFKAGIKKEYPSGRVLDSWNRGRGGGCCNWYGVECGRNGRVSAVTLDGMGLVGEVAFSALSKLQWLRNFSVANNDFSGSLSPDVGNLTGLEYLDLHNNSFSGDVDDILGHLQSALLLVVVDLSQNHFSGSINSIADNSTITESLRYLNVSRNKLSGELFIRDPMPLFDNLEVFDASFNQLSGTIPPFNFILSLRVLRLGNNHFSGSLPEALFKHNSMLLTELDLSSNRLTGPVKSIVSSTLKNLNLSSNKLTGHLPPRVGSCAIVDFSYNMFSEDLSAVQSWGNYVEVIDLSANKLTGSFPNKTSQFLRLMSFKVSNNLLAGELPPVVGTYPEINTIDFSLNQLYGPLPPTLFTSSRLMDLNLSGNSFTGPIPLPKSATSISSDSSSLSSLSTSLVSLDLSNNSLSGSLPQEIRVLTGLRLLNIGRNNISGQIPKEIGLLSKLVCIDLSSNHFEGSIPEELPDGLLDFNVSYNSLSGIIPDNLLRFPDSAFHPGNALLVFPRGPLSGPPGFTNKGKRSHRMKTAVMYILIVGVIGCVILILVSVLICRKFSHRRKDTDPQQVPTTQKAKSPPKSTSFSHDHLLMSGSTSMPLEHGDISSVAKEPIESSPKSGQFGHATISSPPSNNKGKSSMSLIISSPPAIDPCLPENPSVLIVCSPDRLAGDLHLFDNSLVFTAEQLSRAPAEIIGRSCHGTSYKATLESGHVMTVKWLREGIAKTKKEFSREAKKLGSIRHPNIVSLKGYYWGPKEHERLILSNYINAASLTCHLCELEQRKLRPLSLNQRLSIAIDVACSLNYLHNERAIPHGNLKSSNILLQNPNLDALLSDYSLHRILTPAGMADQVLNAGALGYRPPEFASTTKPCPSLKSDVYAFGVVLLEILTGKSAGEIISGNPGIVDLTDWVRSLASENRAYECFDRLIQEVTSAESPPKVLESILGVALRCIRSAPERPEIKTIFEELSSISL